MITKFKKGDQVPPWIIRAINQQDQNLLTFGTDVLVRHGVRRKIIGKKYDTDDQLININTDIGNFDCLNNLFFNQKLSNLTNQ